MRCTLGTREVSKEAQEGSSCHVKPERSEVPPRPQRGKSESQRAGNAYVSVSTPRSCL